MKFLPLILSNFKRHRIRLALTILSVLVAFVLFGYLSAVRKAFEMGVDVAGADRLIVRNKISLIMPLPRSYESDLERIDGVEDAVHASWFGGVYQDPKNFFGQFPVDPEEFLAMYPEYVLPAEQMEAWKRTKTGAVAGRTIAERFDWKVGDRIPIQATIWQGKDGGDSWTFDLVGIYDGAHQETDQTLFLFRYDYFDEARAYGEGQVGWYYLRVDDPGRTGEVAAAVDAEFANSSFETVTESEKAFMSGFAKQVGNIGAIVTAVLSAVFFTILLVVGNTMAQSIRERTKELGVLKALGFSSTQMLTFVLAESCVVSGLGGGLGLLAAWLLTLQGDPTGGSLPVFFFPPEDLALGAGLALALGVFTGLPPAIGAMRLNAAEALRRD